MVHYVYETIILCVGGGGARGRACLYPLVNIAYIQYKHKNRMMTEKQALAIYISKLS
jgi:hypothetical protein